MARGVNKVILIGNVGKDPEASYASSGTALVKFSLATNESRKIDGEWKTETEWHKITMFGKVAEVVAEHLKAGSQVYIEGKITYGSYEKDGITRHTTEIIGFNMQMLGGVKKDGGSKPKPREVKESFDPADDIEDDLPF